MSVVKIAKIQGNLHVPNSSDTIAMLTSVLPDTTQITWKKNSEYQMQFEAYNNGSDAYSMLSPGNMVEKNGQWICNQTSYGRMVRKSGDNNGGGYTH